MAKNNLLLVDLNDDKTKKLAETITSDTSRKILNYLADKEDTEANIAQSSGIPLSTVHYHLQKLQEAGLVTADEYHYSKKGREVNHYKLANKYIIIAPKKVYGIKEKLKAILPAAFVSVLGAGLLKLYTVYGSFSFAKASTLSAEIATDAMVESAPALMATKEAAPALMNNAAQISTDICFDSSKIDIACFESSKIAIDNIGYHPPDIALWFLIGAATAIAVYFLASLFWEWLRKK
jgi:DNA-binding transcriptional ArsR family regulator